MTRLNVNTVQASQTIQRLSLLVKPDKLRQINISAVSDAARWGETQVNRLIRRTMNLSRRRVDEAITRKTARDDDGGFTQDIIISRHKIDLHEFDPKQTKKGVSVRVQKGRPRTLIRSGFIIQKFGGKVFKRRKDPARTRKVRSLKGGTVIGAASRHMDVIERDILPGIGQRVLARTESKLILHLQRAKP